MAIKNVLYSSSWSSCDELLSDMGNGYKICEPRSYATRSSRSVAYANSIPACLAGLEGAAGKRRIEKM